MRFFILTPSTFILLVTLAARFCDQDRNQLGSGHIDTIEASEFILTNPHA
jgi:hypothetical protein